MMLLTSVHDSHISLSSVAETDQLFDSQVEHLQLSTSSDLQKLHSSMTLFLKSLDLALPNALGEEQGCFHKFFDRNLQILQQYSTT